MTNHLMAETIDTRWFFFIFLSRIRCCLPNVFVYPIGWWKCHHPRFRFAPFNNEVRWPVELTFHVRRQLNRQHLIGWYFYDEFSFGKHSFISEPARIFRSEFNCRKDGLQCIHEKFLCRHSVFVDLHRALSKHTIKETSQTFRRSNSEKAILPPLWGNCFLLE